jgi:hypothetical protein
MEDKKGQSGTWAADEDIQGEEEDHRGRPTRLHHGGGLV